MGYIKIAVKRTIYTIVALWPGDRLDRMLGYIGVKSYLILSALRLTALAPSQPGCRLTTTSTFNTTLSSLRSRRRLNIDSTMSAPQLRVVVRLPGTRPENPVPDPPQVADSQLVWDERVLTVSS